MRKNLIRATLLITLLATQTGFIRPEESAGPLEEPTPLITAVDTAGRVGSHVAIVSGAEGLPLLAYFDETRADLKVTRCQEPSCSGRLSTTTVDSEDSVGSYVAIAIDGDDLPVLSYFDATSGDLKVARCSTADCSGETTISRLDGDGVVGMFTSIAMGVDGLPVISYFDRGNCALKVAKCNDPACAGGDEVISTVDKKGCVGLFGSLAIAADGSPVIAYYDSDQGRLKVAKCADPACSGGKARISVVDETASAGSFVHLVIGADDRPMISYYSHSHGDLKLAHCNDAACSGGDESIVTLDTEGLVGSSTALGLSEEGRPIVVYQDLTHGLVKLVQCKDPECAEFESPRIVARDEEIMKSFLAMSIGADGTATIALFNPTDGDLGVVRLPLSNR